MTTIYGLNEAKEPTGIKVTDDGSLVISGGSSGPGVIVLAVFRATGAGTGYSIDDIILLRQTPPAAPEYYNATTNAVIDTPDPTELGSVSTASNVVVTSGSVSLEAGTNNIGDVDVVPLPVAFNAGTTGSTTQRMVLATDQTTIPVNDGSGSLTVDSPVDSPVFARLSNGTTAVDLPALLGATNETAPTTDTGSSGLSGRLQRIAQHITSLIDLLPASLGQKTKALSFPVTLSSDESALPVLDSGTGATSDSAATTNTGTFSLIALVKRVIARIFATRIYLRTVISTSGDTTLIAAPSAGQRIVISGFRVQNTTANATSLVLSNGVTIIFSVRTSTDATGLDANYGLGDEIRLSEATALNLNQSGANAHSYSIRYWLESTSTGLPI